MYEFSRTEILLGKENLENIKRSKVMIFGIGGVGSYVAEGLARVGVENFILVDNDTVSLTNLNRQIIALHSTIGKAKVEVMKSRILDINPKAEVKTYIEFYSENNAEDLLKEDCDYIVDAIDSISSKIDLVVRAKNRNIPIISAMGAGNKIDPTRFEVADIYKTTVCPLAKIMRKQLKSRGIKDLKVVYSKEEPIKAKENLDSEVCTGEKRVPGSVSFVPSVVGLIIVSEVIKDLINKNR